MCDTKCKNCKFSQDYYVFSGIAGGTDFLKNSVGLRKDQKLIYGVYNGIPGWGIFTLNKENSLICNNPYSEFYEHGISKENMCDKWCSPSSMDTNSREVDLSNYECDGQLELNLS